MVILKQDKQGCNQIFRTDGSKGKMQVIENSTQIPTLHFRVDTYWSMVTISYGTEHKWTINGDHSDHTNLCIMNKGSQAHTPRN